MNFLVDSLDKIDPPLSTQCRVVALPTRQYSATRRFAVVLPLLELHVKFCIIYIVFYLPQLSVEDNPALSVITDTIEYLVVYNSKARLGTLFQVSILCHMYNNYHRLYSLQIFLLPSYTQDTSHTRAP